MQRGRRMAVVAVVTLTGGLMLAGCQSQPGVAAYVGDTKITIDQVDSIVNEAYADIRAQQGSINADVYGDDRQAVLGDLIFVAMARHYAEQRGLSDPAVDVDGRAASSHLPASDRFVILSAQVTAYRALLLGRADPSQPTDADLRAVYERLPHETVTFDQAKAQLPGLFPKLPNAVGLRNELRTAEHVTVNPRYRGVEIPLYAEQLADNRTYIGVTLPLGTGDSDFVSS